MKFTINGFSQKKLLEFSLDATDALLLRYFIDFRDSGEMLKEIVNNETYYWLRYDGIIKELPILNLSKPDSVYRRFKKMSKAGVLKHKTVKRNGTYSYFNIGPKYIALISDSPDINPERVRMEIRKGTDINPEQNINLLKDSSTKDINNIYSRITDYLNLKANTSYRSSTKKTKDLIKARLNEGFKEDDFYKVIDNKTSEWTGTEWEKFLRPDTLFGSKFEGYLNQKQSKGTKKGNVFVKQDSFNGYQQRRYDGSDGGMTIDELEKQLLGR